MVPTEQITRERLAGWTKRLDSEHATPMLLIGIGHDHTSGQAVLCIPEDIPMERVRELLQFTLDRLPG